MNTDRVYLDWNATAPLLDEAREAVLVALDCPGNPSSVHGEGRAARAMVTSAREAVAALCNASAQHVLFTSGATEAINHVLTPDWRMGRSALPVPHCFVSAVEHPAVLAGGRFPSEAVTVLPVDQDGRLDLAALEAALHPIKARGETFILALQAANNETGVLQPVAEAGAIVNALGGIFIVDAVQAPGRIPVTPDEWSADFIVLSAHKLGGPKGIGALVSRGETLMPVPLVRGGGQEKGHRAGTENLAGIAGFGAAAKAAFGALCDIAPIESLRNRMEAAILAEAPDAIVHGRAAPRLANTSFFSLPGLKAETAQIAFDMEGIAVSAGAACSSGKVGASHVLKAMGADAGLGAIRVSLGPSTTDADIDRFLAAFTVINRRRTARMTGLSAA